MNNKYRTILDVIVILMLGVVIGLLVGGKQPSQTSSQLSLGGVTNYNKLSIDGYFVAGGKVESTTTLVATTTFTLNAFDLQDNSVISLVPGTTSATTVVLPASSTFPYTGNDPFLLGVGQNRQYLFVNSSSTGPVLTLAAGAGETLETSSSSKSIAPGGSAEVDFWRIGPATSTNILVIMQNQQ